MCSHLVHNGIITIETINESYPKCPTLLKSVNLNTGRQSMVVVAFNDDGWGKVTWSYMKSAARTTQLIHQFKKIEKAMKEYARGNGETLGQWKASLQSGSMIIWMMMMTK